MFASLIALLYCYKRIFISRRLIRSVLRTGKLVDFTCLFILQHRIRIWQISSRGIARFIKLICFVRRQGHRLAGRIGPAPVQAASEKPLEKTIANQTLH